jgi:hypothetical protein
MGISEHYFTERQAHDFDDLLFLTVPQQASSPGGGYRLLGSLVERRGGLRRYPVPELLDGPGGILDAIVARRERLGLAGQELTPSKVLAGSSRELHVEKRHLTDAGIDSVPMVPARLSLGLDFSRVKRTSLEFGEGTRVAYIPRGYLHKLYHAVDGKSEALEPTGLLKKHMVVQAVLLTRSFRMTFSSDSTFESDFEAAISAKNRVSEERETGLKVQYEVVRSRELSAVVSSEDEYLVGLRAVRWRQFDMA